MNIVAETTTNGPEAHARRWIRRLQTATVAEWRPRIAALVAGLPEAHRDEAAQVAAIGVLRALERWQPGSAFEPLCWEHISDELRRFQRHITTEAARS